MLHPKPLYFFALFIPMSISVTGKNFLTHDFTNQPIKNGIEINDTERFILSLKEMSAFQTAKR